MFTQARNRRSVTLLEVVVVGVALALLLLILTPSLARTRVHMRRSDCLSNLYAIGLATQAYAAESPKELIVPIHMNMVRTCDYWEWRTVHWFAWGGQTPTRHFMHTRGAGYWLSDQPPPEPPPYTASTKPEYAAHRRPLNPYIAPGLLDVYRCPADTGYPDDHQIDDAPIYNAGRLCWDTLGNSYRASLGPIYVLVAGTYSSRGAFSAGPNGHRLSTLPNLGRLILLGDAPFFYLIGRDDCCPSPPLSLPGWHGQTMADNLLYCDGSARRTSVIGSFRGPGRRPLPADALGLGTPPICVGFSDILSAGPTWQLDAYPTPGAVIWGDWSVSLNQYSHCWPWMNAQQNLAGPNAPEDQAGADAAVLPSGKNALGGGMSSDWGSDAILVR